mgnify:CR=1 FL=1
MTDAIQQAIPSARGPQDHAIRDQILGAAHGHFRRHGYGKTTVSDLARDIGVSKAYIYKFFDSKQGIGQAICATLLDQILAEVRKAVNESDSATQKLRMLIETMTSSTLTVCFTDRQLFDLAVHSCADKWPSSQAYIAQIHSILAEIIAEGRRTGEFERKTPLDETCRAIAGAMQPFVNPVMLQHNLDDLARGVNEATSLILRSLAP